MDGSCPNHDWRVQSLAVKADPLSPSATCAEVRQLLWRNPAQSLVAVVDGDRPVGMIVRSDLFSTMARPYYPELYDRRPISDLMMRDPIVVDGECDVDELGAIIHADRPDEYTIGFIVTAAGRYCGIGSTQRLLGMIARKARWQQRAVEAALQRAAQASEAKSMFLANVSHELRTPLNAITGFSALMQGQAFGPIGNGRYLGYLEDIHSSGQHLLAVINDLIDLARAESGRLDIEDDDVDVAEIVAGALRMIGVRAAAAGLTITTDLPPAMPLLRADGRRLRQVLLNLLSNAVKFTPSGGALRVVVGYDERGGLEITVSDTGIGIAAEDLARVMESFGQAGNLYQRKHEGSGLGLPLARRIVELHGGRLDLRSEPGRGTSVSIRLPADRVAAIAA